ncbi:MAG: GTP diphosphokinase [Kangiellaceae bacterium]|nr:GTP diphosphokinase [Kangiellaceae bacterium]
MVQVATIKPPASMDESSFLSWCEQLVYDQRQFDQEVFKKAAHLVAGKLPDNQLSDVSTFTCSFELAVILSDLRVDCDTLVAAMLYPFINQNYLSIEEVKDQCSVSVAAKINGVITLDGVRGLQNNQSVGNDSVQIENLRKMLLVMVDDVSVVLIKLAERLFQLRTAKFKPQSERKQIAQEVNEMFAPLANRLGVGQIKWEMEDLAFRYLHEDEYMRIAKHLAEKRGAREIYVNQVLDSINRSLVEINVKAELMGRAKHIYSIWKKMHRKQVGFEEIYDVRAVRVLVPRLQDCYSVLGVVHGLWKHIPKEFDDYIATPKENGYRSLHTAVIGPDGKTLEIQIRTHGMHQESELGVAAHWKYKEGGANPSGGYEAKMAWLRQLLDWQDEVVDSKQLADEFKSQVFEERIYVFTPQGKLIDLPSGSTALDFAYRVHTDVGHRCRGAKSNGRIVQLTQALETGQKIEILTSKTGGPSRDWLSEQRGYLKSSRARHKVQQWFKHQDKDKNSTAGRLLIEKEIKKNGFDFSDYLKLAKHFNYNSIEELYAGVGAGDKGIHQVMNAVRQLQTNVHTITRESVIKRNSSVKKRTKSSDILVEGVGNLLTRMAGCCKPIPGDDISGFVTLSRGIMIHRSDCRYLLASRDKAPEKILEVSWTHEVNKHYLIDLVIGAYDRKGLLSDITLLMSNEKVSVTSLNTRVNHKELEVRIDVQVELDNLSNVSRLINLVEQLPNIISVNRSSH